MTTVHVIPLPPCEKEVWIVIMRFLIVNVLIMSFLITIFLVKRTG